MAEYHSISDLVKLSINNKQELWQVVLTGQAHDKLMSERDVFAQMKKMYQACLLYTSPSPRDRG